MEALRSRNHRAQIVRGPMYWLSALMLFIVCTSGCSEDVVSSTTPPDGANVTTTTATTTTVSNGAGSVALTLSNAFVAGGASVAVSVSVKDVQGAGVAGALVSFTTDARYGVLTPPSGTTLTDTAGNAAIFLASAGIAGAAVINAETSIGGKTFTVSRNYAVGAATTSTGTTTTTSNMALSLSNTFVTYGSPITATATLKDSDGVGVPGAVVTFSTDDAYGALTPALGTSLTNSSGTATVTLNAANLTASGASTITAAAEVGGKAYTVARGYAVGPTSVSLSSPRFGVSSALSAFATTSVAVTATSGGQPLANQLVTFTSPCAGAGKASLPASTRTDSQGVATVSYLDRGCGSLTASGTGDTITASLSGMATASGNLFVLAPGVGSIQFVSATPSNITLRGAGGAGRQETAVVRFRVVDAANNPLGGRAVAFTLSTAVGGITLSSQTGISDAVSGEVEVIVSAGTVATPVRVIASTTGVEGSAMLSTQSDQLAISVGLPDQDSFSLSVGKLNIEGLEYDGETTTVTARLGDVYNNPVPDGAVVNFLAEGGMIGELGDSLRPTGRCLTVNSACSVTLTSQNPRPANGRVTVTAYAIGEESFVDVNGNGKADLTELSDSTNLALTNADLARFQHCSKRKIDQLADLQAPNSLPLPYCGEAFRDDNFDGMMGSSEVLIDFNGDGARNNYVDGVYQGSMCIGVHCSTTKAIHVWRDAEVIFSGSEAHVTVEIVQMEEGKPNEELPRFSHPRLSSSSSPDPVIDLRAVQPDGQDIQGPNRRIFKLTLRVSDSNGNQMPVGTAVAVSSSNGTLTGNDNLVVQNTASGVFEKIIFLSDDSSLSTVNSSTSSASLRVDQTPIGSLQITVTTPKERVTRVRSIVVRH